MPDFWSQNKPPPFDEAVVRGFHRTYLLRAAGVTSLSAPANPQAGAQLAAEYAAVVTATASPADVAELNRRNWTGPRVMLGQMGL